MGSSADRQRRYRERQRRHAEGDHGMCVAGKCPAVQPGQAVAGASGDVAQGVTGDVTRPVRSPVTNLPPPAGLGVRGTALWEALQDREFGAAHLVQLAEACRTADMIDRLTAELEGEGGQLVELVRDEAESSESVVEVRVVVNGLLAERRQQQEVFRRAVAELRLSGRLTAKPSGVGVPAPTAAADETSAGEEGIGDLIDAAGRFTSQG